MTKLEAFFYSQRQQFPMMEARVYGQPLVYLDSAATAQKPLCVIDAISNFYKYHYGTVHRSVYKTAVDASVSYDATRTAAAKFLNAKSPDEIVFTRGTTDGINLVASAFCRAAVHPGDEILITEMEHHSNIVPWQLAREARNATLRVVPFFDDGTLDLESFKSLLSERTKIVAVTHISNTLGTINPIQEIVQLAHQAGAKVLVDGAQAAPHLPLDVQALDVDFYVFSGHKVFGPSGIGILYAKSELLHEMPPYQGGGDMIETVTFEKTTYNAPPVKFEAGTPSLAEVMGLKSAFDFLTSIGMHQIHEFELELLDLLWKRLEAIPKIKILGTRQNRGSLVSFYVDGVHPLDIATLLDLHGVAIRSGHLCTQPIMRHYSLDSGVCRASLAFYNTKEEIHFFADMLTKVLKQLL